MSPSAVFRRAFELLFVILSAVSANAQCPNNNTVQGSAITVPCPGSVSGGCIIRNRYALVNVVSGRIYTFSVCNAPWNTNITLYNNTGGSTSATTSTGAIRFGPRCSGPPRTPVRFACCWIAGPVMEV
ncbi:MAG: hypothetical protein IPH60_16865 [Flavobacteriales bacterium]|nr:hypothetical protein [Flavobacteriales bacterium]